MGFFLQGKGAAFAADAYFPCAGESACATDNFSYPAGTERALQLADSALKLALQSLAPLLQPLPAHAPFLFPFPRS